MRIVGITPEPMANSDYRVRLPIEALASRGHSAEVVQWSFYRGGDPPSLAALRQADVVHIWRLHEPPVQRLAEALRRDGVAVVWDNDDDLLRLPPGRLPKGVSVANEQTRDELVAIIKTAHVVTTTCQELARRLKRASGADVHVIGNYVAAETLRRPASTPSKELVIGWVAGGEHKVDLKQLRLRVTLDRVLERHPHVRVMSVGLPLGLRSDRYQAHESVPLDQLPSTLASFDIGIAPLADVSFNRVRSDVKLKEYAAAGVPWLASPIGPYSEMGEEQGGRLVKDPFWQQGLEAMIVDVDARERLREQAVAWGRTQTIENHAHLWESVFERAATRARGGQPPPEVTGPELDREPEVDQSRRVEVEPAPPERRGLMRRLMRR